MLITQGIISGLIATIFFDLFNQALNFAYNIDKPRWNFLGRYFLGYIEGAFVRKSLFDDDEIDNELFWGYIIHYFIGIIYGLILLAYTFGFLTVLGGWCFLMPFAYNLGFFASKAENTFKILSQNLIVHFVFGTGLFFGLYIIY